MPRALTAARVDHCSPGVLGWPGETDLEIRIAIVSLTERFELRFRKLENEPRLRRYALLHITLGELLRRRGDLAAAAKSLEEAKRWVTNDRERAFVESKLQSF